jgi:hypothetical protein
VKIVIYDVLGNVVREIVNDVLSPGRYEVEFDAGGLSSGTYFYKLTAGNVSFTKRMVLMK